MDMFQSFLSSIPSSRSDMVNDLELPEDISLSPYVWTEPEELVELRSEGSSSPISIDEELRRGSVNTASSMALSRAMTDSEIDYGMSRRYKTRSFSDPWDQMKAALAAFPPDYLASLQSFQTTSEETADSSQDSTRPLHNEDLLLKMQRFFDEECTVFEPDDEGLLDLEEALQNMDLRSLDSDFSITP